MASSLPRAGAHIVSGTADSARRSPHVSISSPLASSSISSASPRISIGQHPQLMQIQSPANRTTTSHESNNSSRPRSYSVSAASGRRVLAAAMALDHVVGIPLTPSKQSAAASAAATPPTSTPSPTGDNAGDSDELDPIASLMAHSKAAAAAKQSFIDSYGISQEEYQSRMARLQKENRAHGGKGTAPKGTAIPTPTALRKRRNTVASASNSPVAGSKEIRMQRHPHEHEQENDQDDVEVDESEIQSKGRKSARASTTFQPFAQRRADTEQDRPDALSGSAFFPMPTIGGAFIDEYFEAEKGEEVVTERKHDDSFRQEDAGQNVRRRHSAFYSSNSAGEARPGHQKRFSRMSEWSPAPNAVETNAGMPYTPNSKPTTPSARTIGSLALEPQPRNLRTVAHAMSFLESNNHLGASELFHSEMTRPHAVKARQLRKEVERWEQEDKEMKRQEELEVVEANAQREKFEKALEKQKKKIQQEQTQAAATASLMSSKSSKGDKPGAAGRKASIMGSMSVAFRSDTVPVKRNEKKRKKKNTKGKQPDVRFATVVDPSGDSATASFAEGGVPSTADQSNQFLTNENRETILAQIEARRQKLEIALRREQDANDVAEDDDEDDDEDDSDGSDEESAAAKESPASDPKPLLKSALASRSDSPSRDGKVVKKVAIALGGDAADNALSSALAIASKQSNVSPVKGSGTRSSKTASKSSSKTSLANTLSKKASTSGFTPAEAKELDALVAESATHQVAHARALEKLQIKKSKKNSNRASSKRNSMEFVPQAAFELTGNLTATVLPSQKGSAQNSMPPSQSGSRSTSRSHSRQASSSSLTNFSSADLSTYFEPIPADTAPVSKPTSSATPASTVAAASALPAPISLNPSSSTVKAALHARLHRNVPFSPVVEGFETNGTPVFGARGKETPTEMQLDAPSDFVLSAIVPTKQSKLVHHIPTASKSPDTEGDTIEVQRDADTAKRASPPLSAASVDSALAETNQSVEFSDTARLKIEIAGANEDEITIHAIEPVHTAESAAQGSTSTEAEATFSAIDALVPDTLSPQLGSEVTSGDDPDPTTLALLDENASDISETPSIAELLRIEDEEIAAQEREYEEEERRERQAATSLAEGSAPTTRERSSSVGASSDGRPKSSGSKTPTGSSGSFFLSKPRAAGFESLTPANRRARALAVAARRKEAERARLVVVEQRKAEIEAAEAAAYAEENKKLLAAAANRPRGNSVLMTSLVAPEGDHGRIAKRLMQLGESIHSTASGSESPTLMLPGGANVVEMLKSPSSRKREREAIELQNSQTALAFALTDPTLAAAVLNPRSPSSQNISPSSRRPSTFGPKPPSSRAFKSPTGIATGGDKSGTPKLAPTAAPNSGARGPSPAPDAFAPFSTAFATTPSPQPTEIRARTPSGVTVDDSGIEYPSDFNPLSNLQVMTEQNEALKAKTDSNVAPATSTLAPPDEASIEKAKLRMAALLGQSNSSSHIYSRSATASPATARAGRSSRTSLADQTLRAAVQTNNAARAVTPKSMKKEFTTKEANDATPTNKAQKEMKTETATPGSKDASGSKPKRKKKKAASKRSIDKPNEEKAVVEPTGEGPAKEVANDSVNEGGFANVSDTTKPREDPEDTQVNDGEQASRISSPSRNTASGAGSRISSRIAQAVEPTVLQLMKDGGEQEEEPAEESEDEEDEIDEEEASEEEQPEVEAEEAAEGDEEDEADVATARFIESNLPQHSELSDDGATESEDDGDLIQAKDLRRDDDETEMDQIIQAEATQAVEEPKSHDVLMPATVSIDAEEQGVSETAVGDEIISDSQVTDDQLASEPTSLDDQPVNDEEMPSAETESSSFLSDEASNALDAVLQPPLGESTTSEAIPSPTSSASVPSNEDMDDVTMEIIRDLATVSNQPVNLPPVEQLLYENQTTFSVSRPVSPVPTLLVMKEPQLQEIVQVELPPVPREHAQLVEYERSLEEALLRPTSISEASSKADFEIKSLKQPTHAKLALNAAATFHAPLDEGFVESEADEALQLARDSSYTGLLKSVQIRSAKLSEHKLKSTVPRVRTILAQAVEHERLSKVTDTWIESESKKRLTEQKDAEIDDQPDSPYKPSRSRSTISKAAILDSPSAPKLSGIAVARPSRTHAATHNRLMQLQREQVSHLRAEGRKEPLYQAPSESPVYKKSPRENPHKPPLAIPVASSSFSFYTGANEAPIQLEFPPHFPPYPPAMHVAPPSSSAPSYSSPRHSKTLHKVSSNHNVLAQHPHQPAISGSQSARVPTSGAPQVMLTTQTPLSAWRSHTDDDVQHELYQHYQSIDHHQIVDEGGEANLSSPVHHSVPIHPFVIPPASSQRLLGYGSAYGSSVADTSSIIGSSNVGSLSAAILAKSEYLKEMPNVTKPLFPSYHSYKATILKKKTAVTEEVIQHAHAHVTERHSPAVAVTSNATHAVSTALAISKHHKKKK